MGLKRILLKAISGKAPSDDWIEFSQIDNFDPFTSVRIAKSFRATVADEISVNKGEEVSALYRDDEWVYIQVIDGRRGFVPRSYCKLHVADFTRHMSSEVSCDDFEKKWQKSNLERYIESLPSDPKVDEEPFVLKEHCRARVLYTFNRINEDDLDVEADETVTVLNLSDPDWIYVRNDSNQMGFVPSSFLDIPQSVLNHSNENWENASLFVIEPFSARCPLDISVEAGDWVRCLTNPVNGWLWGQKINGESNKQGFIPAKNLLLVDDV